MLSNRYRSQLENKAREKLVIAAQAAIQLYIEHTRGVATTIVIKGSTTLKFNATIDASSRHLMDARLREHDRWVKFPLLVVFC